MEWLDDKSKKKSSATPKEEKKKRGSISMSNGSVVDEEAVKQLAFELKKSLKQLQQIKKEKEEAILERDVRSI
jgi:hypothetical protein